jgi:hypothetical protein
LNGITFGPTYEQLLEGLPGRQEVLAEACRIVCPYCADHSNLRPESRELIPVSRNLFGHQLSDGNIRICVATAIWNTLHAEFPESRLVRALKPVRG